MTVWQHRQWKIQLFCYSAGLEPGVHNVNTLDCKNLTFVFQKKEGPEVQLNQPTDIRWTSHLPSALVGNISEMDLNLPWLYWYNKSWHSLGFRPLQMSNTKDDGKCKSRCCCSSWEDHLCFNKEDIFVMIMVGRVQVEEDTAKKKRIRVVKAMRGKEQVKRKWNRNNNVLQWKCKACCCKFPSMPWPRYL